MTVSWRPTGQKYRGLGEIRKGDQLLAKVQYDLDEDQEHISVEEMGNRGQLKQLGEKRVRGTIVVVEGDEDLTKHSSGPVTLHLADNRSVSLVIESRTKQAPPTYKVSQ
jgi:hypothetical protein